VWQPAGVTGTSALVASESLDAWKDYLRFHLVEHYASVLPKAVRTEEFAFYGTTLTGASEMPERNAGGIAAVNGAVGEVLGQLYVKQYFPPAAKAKAVAMAEDLRTAFLARIANATWMSPETKKKALAKMQAFQIGIGYPDVWIDFARLDVVRGDAFGNARRAEAFYRERDLARLKQSVYPVEWPMNAQVPGAVIMFSPNFEVFSAGVLQPPFFDADGDAASNYGSAGAGMAHEISHSFDELGNLYDAHGRLGKWWTAEDETRYRAAAAKLATQFDKYCPFADTCVKGQQVLTESIADLVGLLVAHDAYELSLKGKPDAVIGGLTGEQRFFVAFSQRWRKLQSDAATRRQVATDTHPPGEYRSDTVRNVESWYDAFKVSASDKLYVKPDDRVKIW
jgi:putative endopeptidase